jgi:anthranilate synthase component 1
MSAEPLVHPIQIERSTLLALHAQHPERYPALLESAATGEPLGRYDILFAFPGARLTLDASGELGDESRSSPRTSPDSFLDALDSWWCRERKVGSAPLPFHGGWLVYLSYELAAYIEPSLKLPRPTQGPIAQAIRVPAAIVIEHALARAWVIVEAAHADLIAQIEADIEAIGHSNQLDGSLLVGAVEEDAPLPYLDAVEQALQYIAAGDVYQANLSRAWRAHIAPEVRAHQIYERLRRTNPAPFGALAQLDGVCIISSSPERLVEVREGSISTRPIAGTRPRGEDERSDLGLARELRAHPKEQAEHVMLIDLERNDLGRICQAGTVEVDEFMMLESYAHVHHIVSNVRGRLRPNISPGQVIAAVFPGGTITGCPKIRCMQIIGELEGEARGAYTGSLGYLNLDGSMDLNILIRSLELREDSLVLRAGAGIVADSVPERELEETRAKARGVLRALS